MTGKWGGGGRGFKGGGGGSRGGPTLQQQNVRDKREEIKNFLGFYKRTDSVCIDLYQPEFFRRKPSWEEMAIFVSQQLCLSGPLRASLKDIQLHPVKKHLFLKFRDTVSRDQVAGKLKTGVEWPAFEATVHGWAMDKPVMVVRIHGVSPESSKQDIQSVMAQYGEVLDVEIGYISKKILPGVTNGTWTVKMILEEEKVLPSFVFMKEEGEVWQLTHKNQVNVCWKCGQYGHLGARCNQPTLTFDALGADEAVGEGRGSGTGAVRSWAHVVRTGSGSDQHQNELQRQEEILKQVKETRIRKEEEATEKRLLEEKEAAAKVKQSKDTEAAKAEKTAHDAKVVVAAENAKAAEAAIAMEFAEASLDADVTGGVVDEKSEVKETEQVVQGVDGQVATSQAGLLDHNFSVDRDSSMSETECESAEPEMDLSKVKNKSKKKNSKNSKKLRSNPVKESSEEMDVSKSEKHLLMKTPCVIGVSPLVDFNSQASSKAGLTPESDPLSANYQSQNSQATSKAGISLGSEFDPDLTDCGGLKMIVPEGSSDSSSVDSSPRPHKQAASHVDSGEQFSDLPCNTRSVNNRGLKAKLKENGDKNNFKN